MNRAVVAVALLLTVACSGERERATPRVTTGLLPSDGGSLYVESAGTGSPVVFLHSFDANRQAWALVARGLAATHRVVLVDLPGRGQSPGGDEPFFGYAQAAAQVARAIGYLGFDTVAVVGASTGANVAIRVAVAMPGRVTALVAMGGFTGISPEATQMLRQPGCEANPPEYWQEQARLHQGGEAQARRIATQFCHEVDNPEMTTPFDVSGVTARTLFIHGVRDPIFPVAGAHALAKRIPGAAVWSVDDGGHLPCFVEATQPDCIARIGAFIDGR